MRTNRKQVAPKKQQQVNKQRKLALAPPVSEKVSSPPKFKLTFKNENQKQYVQTIQSNDLVFGIGPAATGKTFLAVTQAVRAFVDGDVKRIILVRPAVEAGEKLGYLPGDLLEKISPFMQPLYDALYEILGKEKVQSLIRTGEIEIATLGFMRGRTLKESFIILDEAQNTTASQMRMFLTRLGEGSKVVITGDTTQIDLPKASQSGLSQAIKLLSKIEGVAAHYFDRSEVLRHRLVREIVDVYEENEL